MTKADREIQALARAESRARVDRLAGIRAVPSPSRIALRIVRWCAFRGFLASDCLAAHRASLQGLPHDALRASVYRRAALVAHRRSVT